MIEVCFSFWAPTVCAALQKPQNPITLNPHESGQLVIAA